MDSREIEERRLTLDDLAHFDDEMGIEFWYAREIQKFLGYTEWRNFEVAISRAKISADTTKRPDGDHFVEVNKMVSLGSGSSRQIRDYKLTRYAYMNETFWMPQKEIAELFGKDKSTISRHLRNIFESGELDENSVVAEIATTAADGKIGSRLWASWSKELSKNF